MIRLFSPLLAFAALLSANAVAAPVRHRPAPHRAAAAPTLPADADPALWVAKDADTTIYLFGTIHVLKPGLTWFDEAVRKAFDSSSELRLEMVLPAQATAQATALRLGTTTSGPTLPERLPPAVRAKYLTTVTGLGLPATALDRFQPWFAANNLTVLPLLKLGYALDSGAERVLTEQAKTEGKTISGFETLEQQLGFFTSLSEKTQVTFLKGVLDELPKVGATTDAMVAEWARGDPNALAKLLNDDLSDDRELAKTLLQDRNARWADWIAARMAQPGTVFIAVGAGHLAGPDSVQAKLAAKGVKVERVRY